MTKKDYIKVAELFAEMRQAQNIVETHNLQSNEYVKGARACLDSLTREMMDIFADDNPRFDRSRFLRACGLE